jgi:SSS family solute:Na+ symporter
MGGMLTVFFYARLWRRAGILTDVEFIELRYEGRPAAALRGFSAVYGGLVVNCVTMGWVMLAMTKILDVMLGWDKALSVGVLVVVALAYTMLSGFWGVVMTDFVQFIIAMIGSVSLAVIVLADVGGPAGMVARLHASPDFDLKVLQFVPDLRTAGRLAVITFVVQVTLQWWGGGQGGGYIAQRLFATRDEKSAVLAALWFNFAHYVLRPWPWIVVGLVSIIHYPLGQLEDPEMAYPLMIAKSMPSGLRGLMVASLLAAFMSTIDTQLNWGASYLINDVYKRFLRPQASQHEYVTASRVCMLVIMVFGVLAAWLSSTIAGLWIFLMNLTVGVSFVVLLRWFWWRINAWAEISAMVGSLIIANGNVLLKPVLALLSALGLVSTASPEWLDWFYASETYAVRLAVILAVCTIAWIVVMFLTRPVSAGHLDRFYRRVRPGGYWGPVAARCPEVVADLARHGWLGWFAGVVCVYAGLYGVGVLLLGRPVLGVAMLVLCVLAGWLTLRAVTPANPARARTADLP